MEIRLLNDNLTVVADKDVTRSSHILVDPHGSKSPLLTGRVHRVGPGKWLKNTSTRIPMELREGDRVAFFRWHGQHTPGKQQAAFLSDMSEALGGDVYILKKPDVLVVVELENGEALPLLDVI